MSEDTRNDGPEGEVGTDRTEDARRNRTIRFSDSEWEEVRRAAMVHDTPPAEFVRETILALARNPESGISGAVAPSLAPLIERMFRYTWFLATEKRDAMVREGREDELDALVAEARTLHESLRRGAPAEPERRPTYSSAASAPITIFDQSGSPGTLPVSRWRSSVVLATR